MIEQQFIEYVVKNLVDHPDDVKINRTVDDRGVLLELTVNPDDLGRVIGRKGSTAQSLRNLLRALGMKNDARYNLKIVDTDDADDTARDSAVENSESESVENESDRTKKLREDLADISDLDI